MIFDFSGLENHWICINLETSTPGHINHDASSDKLIWKCAICGLIQFHFGAEIKSYSYSV